MKFEVGEIAVLAHASTNRWFEGSVGDEVEILKVGPIPAGYMHDDTGITNKPADYIVLHGGKWWAVDELRLRKRYPPGSDIARDIMAKLPKTEAA